MKVLSVIEAFCHGGAQTVLLDLVLSLPEHQHRVVHFSRANGIAPEPTFVDALKAAGIDCIDTHWNSLRDQNLRAQLLEGFRPDVVLFHWWGNDPWMPWLSARKNGNPSFVCVLHHSGIPARSGYDRYVLVTRSQLPQVDQIAPQQIQVIPNGVDTGRFFTRTERLSHAIDRNHRFMVGRLSELREGKIPADWVRTIASYRLENSEFVIAGDGALLPQLRASALELKIADQVSFPGYIRRAEVPALLETFDVFCYVTSSAVECCPLALLEAMASGLPVVAEKRGGIPEIVIDGHNGLLAESTAEIGDRLRLLRDDTALRQRLSRGARATAEKFSLQTQMGAYRELLADLKRERAAGEQPGVAR